MTTYSRTITLNDSEYIALQAALEQMMKHCDEQINSGQKVPFTTYGFTCRKLSRKLSFCTPFMTSTNNFGQ